MSDLQARFDSAAADAKRLPEPPGNDTMLRLYALYKQGSQGDVRGPKPGFFDFVDTAKHEAWAKLEGTPREDAMRRYIELVAALIRSPDTA